MKASSRGCLCHTWGDGEMGRWGDGETSSRGCLCHTWCMDSAVHLVQGARFGIAHCVALEAAEYVVLLGAEAGLERPVDVLTCVPPHRDRVSGE